MGVRFRLFTLRPRKKASRVVKLETRVMAGSRRIGARISRFSSTAPLRPTWTNSTKRRAQILHAQWKSNQVAIEKRRMTSANPLHVELHANSIAKHAGRLVFLERRAAFSDVTPIM